MSVFINRLLGLGASDLSAGQMCARAVVVYFLSLMMVRLSGSTRFAGRYAAIDIVLSITLGATFSRAIVGISEFFPTLAAGITLVGIHWLLAKLAFYFPRLENLVKGEPRLLIRDGQLNHQSLKKGSLTSRDIETTLRSKGIWASIDRVDRAVLEPNGDISVTIRSDAKGEQG